MSDSFITAGETILLIGLLIGPSLVVGSGIQYWLFKKKGILDSQLRRTAYLSFLVSAALTVLLSISIWLLFPGLAPDVLDPASPSRYFFWPSILSAMAVFSSVIIFVAKKESRAENRDGGS